MKVLEYIQSLIVPTHMIKRKRQNILISILIFVLATYLLSVPISSYLSKDRYNTLDNGIDFFVFNYVNDDNTLNRITDEEKELYNMVTFAELKALKPYISIEGVGNASAIEVGKEYVLKSVVPTKDEEGTITAYENYYIHIVFDTGEESVYDISEKFNKLPNDEDGTFRHFLLVFYNQGFLTRSSYQITQGLTSSQVTYYRNCDIDFNTITSATDISHTLEDMMIPLYKYQYRLRSFLFVFLFPTIISLLFSFVLKNSGQLKGAKEYFNIAAVSTIPLVILCCLFSLISVSFCNLLFRYYSIIYVIYYFILIVVLNRRPRIE